MMIYKSFEKWNFFPFDVFIKYFIDLIWLIIWNDWFWIRLILKDKKIINIDRMIDQHCTWIRKFYFFVYISVIFFARQAKKNDSILSYDGYCRMLFFFVVVHFIDNWRRFFFEKNNNFVRRRQIWIKSPDRQILSKKKIGNLFLVNGHHTGASIEINFFFLKSKNLFGMKTKEKKKKSGQ